MATKKLSGIKLGIIKNHGSLPHNWNKPDNEAKLRWWCGFTAASSEPLAQGSDSAARNTANL